MEIRGTFWDIGRDLILLRTTQFARAQIFSGTLAIGDDGALYVPGNDGYLYAFR